MKVGLFIVLFLVGVFNVVQLDDTADSYCVKGEEYCLPVVTDFTKDKCLDRGNTWYYILPESKRFPICKNFPVPDYDNPSGCKTNSDCIPGYECQIYDPTDPEGSYCSPADDVKCFSYHANVKDNDDFKVYWKPDCDFDGFWSPKQCKGDVTSGRCFCYDPKGKRLFGQQWIDQAENMTCACSRLRYKLEQDTSRWYVSLHCDSTGNFEELQCDSGICWCSDTRTLTPVSTVVPESLMKKLPCFTSMKIGGQYTRQCDSVKYAQKYIEHIFRLHGTMNANFARFLCDADGSYGPYRISDGIAYCAWRDGSKLGTWQSPVDVHTVNLTCNCARDSKYYTQHDMQQLMMCDPNGEYHPSQIAPSGDYYCIDRDGYRSAAEETTSELTCNNLFQ